MKTDEMPYVSNYRVLKEFLDKHEARCMWQLRLGGTSSAPRGYVEMWQFPNGKQCIITVHSRGWDIYTPDGTNSTNAAIGDACIRLGLT